MKAGKRQGDVGELDRVLVHQDELLKDVRFADETAAEERIGESVALLRSLGVEPPERSAGSLRTQNASLSVPSWEEVLAEATEKTPDGVRVESLFTEEELRANSLAIKELQREYDDIHRLDRYDVAIAASAGLLAAAVDILLVGIPKKTPDGLKAGPLSDYIRDHFDKAFPPEEMERLANSKVSKVPFDAQDNRHTAIHVEGLCTYYHRLLSLGHDPLLGFVFGVADILNGTMTTIDKNGDFVVQVVEGYADRREGDLFAAVAKQIAHLKSDMTTSMGLPAPLMGLFDLLQVGSIGEYEQAIAEIVQGMYYGGYDFIHFCSMSVSAMLVEVVVRVGYALKRMHEGAMLKDSIPITTDRERMPKLATMLFMANSAAAAINAGKVAFTKDPMAINYPQWLAFAKYSYQQLRWSIVTKPAAREAHVSEAIDAELNDVYRQIDETISGRDWGLVTI